MVLGVGLVSSIIIYKSRSNYKTRLQKLEQKLKKHPLKSINFYEAPTKKLITITLVICFILAFTLFEKHYFHEVMAEQIGKQNRREGISNLISIKQYRKDNNIQELEPIEAPTKEVNSSNGQFEYQTKILQDYKKISNLIFWIQFSYVVCIVALISSLKLKIVTVSGSHISFVTYSIQGHSQLSKLQWKAQKMNIRIYEKGERKFNHYINEYAIQVFEGDKGCSIEIIRRGDVFHARKTLIEMGSVLDFQAVPKIH